MSGAGFSKQAISSIVNRDKEPINPDYLLEEETHSEISPGFFFGTGIILLQLILQSKYLGIQT